MCANLPIIYKLLSRTLRRVHAATSPEARSIPVEHSGGHFRPHENNDGQPGWARLSNSYHSHDNNYTATFEAQTEAQGGHNI
jgi:hypothetical protein